jgi:hypothetical protein
LIEWFRGSGVPGLFVAVNRTSEPRNSGTPEALLNE